MTTNYEVRREVNEKSRNKAEHHAEPWVLHEIETLMLWSGSESELHDLAEMLGRTVEACRQMYYTVRKRPDRRFTVQRTTTTTTVTTTVTEQVSVEICDHCHCTKPCWC